MASDRGNQKPRPPGTSPERAGESPPPEDGVPGGRLPALPEFARRVIGLGMSGVVLTEETLRKALGDTVPKDWADFAADQSERTRKEFLERLSFELAQSIEKVDLAQVLGELMKGRTLEVKAEIRLGADTPSKFQAAVRDDVPAKARDDQENE